ncbi:MASE3 domain-containing protein [Candidatus Xianfuyuplasma coldseepsis]|uniref:Diguanylate cyclase n=1 Tax=Candidatus Xianfuyuplasma coldseepsis TaxID=2782163 RepID=A0A7L7KR43_9MOLU|nr:MASE3 domain-containing protein [Xianfuyuplasma coldseepsis]QMS85291.1 diguanylate cyclase [Xianfuyuplasma coldseepsis]
MIQRIQSLLKDVRWKPVVIFVVTTPLLFILLHQISVGDDVLYHTIMELITVLTGLIIIVILISMWKFVQSNTLIMVICISLFFVSVIDVFHILSYPGIHLFSSADEALNLTLSFWIFARVLQGASIVFAILLTRFIKRVNYVGVIFAYVFITTLGILFILQGYFPQMYVIGQGLTTTKVINEYLIILLFVVGGYLLVRYKLITNNNMMILFLFFLLFQIFSEFFFTQYTITTDIAFVVGHHFKILAFFIITYILLKSTIIAPSETLYQEILHQSDQLSKLLKYEKLTREITEICSVAIRNDNFINDVLTLLGSTLEVDHTFIYKHIEDRKVFKLTNAWFNHSSQLVDDDFEYEFFVVDSLLNKFNKGMTHYSADTSTIENEHEKENFLTIGIYAYINEPLFVNGRFYGFMGYNMTTTNRETLEDDITLIKSISKILTQTMERTKAFKEIEHLNNHDDLTGAYNRRHFEDYIKQVDTNPFYPLGIVVIDLNGLKLINDAFGHLAGDEMLIKTVELIERNLEKSSTLFRIGGDEFVVVTTNTTSEYVYTLFENIERQCAEVHVSSVQLSLSYGVHIRTSDRLPFYEEFKIAEDEMYRMKLMDVPSMRTNAIETILNTLFEKDQYSKDHCTNVSLMTEVLAQKMGFNTNQVGKIKMAGLLHDIGKIIVPDRILKKEGPLTELEYLEIKNHTEIGFRILSSTKDFREIAEYVLSHHEFYNGGGYPHGLKGDEIPIESRIISVVDAYDAMVSYRSYRRSFTKQEAIQELKNNRGTQFDPDVVNVFVEHINAVTEVRPDSDNLDK